LSTYSTELLEQAKLLARKEPRRPKQASLRRAVSAAYYAMFHFLISEASRRMIGAAHQHASRRAILGRAFSHSQMSQAAKSFAGGTLPALLRGQIQAVSPGLKVVAETFVDTQQERYAADYDLVRSFTRHDVLQLIARVESALHDWKQIRDDDDACYFLIWMLVGHQLKQRQ